MGGSTSEATCASRSWAVMLRKRRRGGKRPHPITPVARRVDAPLCRRLLYDLLRRRWDGFGRIFRADDFARYALLDGADHHGALHGEAVERVLVRPSSVLARTQYSD